MVTQYDDGESPGTGMRGAMTLDGRSKLPAVFMAAIAVAIPAILVGRALVGIAVVLALLMVPFLPRRREGWELAKQVFTSRAALLVAVVAIAWLPGLLESPDPLRSLETHVRTFAYVAGGVVAWAALRVERDNAAVAYRVVLVTAGLLGAVGLIGIFASDEFLQLFRGHGWTEYPARRTLKESASSAVILVPILALAGARLGRAWPVIAAIAGAELLSLVLFTSNRSALAGLLCATFVAVVLFALARRRRATVLPVVAVTVVLLAIGGWALDRYKYPSYAYPEVALTPIPYWLIDPPRQAIWLNAWEAGERWRLFGAGINAIDQLPGAHEWNEMTGTENIPLHPHNWVLEVIVETGLIGFAAMMAALAYITQALVRGYLRTRQSGVLAAIYVWVSYWTIGLFSVSYWSSWWQVSFVAAMTICLAFPDSQDARRTADPAA